MSERRKRLPVSLGDALSVQARLRPRDDETRRVIAQLLGLERPVSAPIMASIGPQMPSEGPAISSPAPRDFQAGEIVEEAGVPETPQLRGAMTSCEFTGRITFDAPDWAARQSHPFEPATGTDASLPPPPLFARGQSRLILSATLATFGAGSDVEVDRVTEMLARQQTIKTIPYRQVSTLRRGAQVLLDDAQAMDPLHLDVKHLLADLDRLFSRSHLEILHFAHCPSSRDANRRGVWPDHTASRAAWRPPRRGLPVLVISDFAIATRIDDVDYASLPEWLEFAQDAVAAGCYPIGLVPYPPNRWPAALTGTMTLVHWSEHTSVRQVVRALRESPVAREARQ